MSKVNTYCTNAVKAYKYILAVSCHDCQRTNGWTQEKVTLTFQILVLLCVGKKKSPIWTWSTLYFVSQKPFEAIRCWLYFQITRVIVSPHVFINVHSQQNMGWCRSAKSEKWKEKLWYINHFIFSPRGGLGRYVDRILSRGKIRSPFLILGLKLAMEGRFEIRTQWFSLTFHAQSWAKIFS